jgi:mono/diheme cytochrome c family protein
MDRMLQRAIVGALLAGLIAAGAYWWLSAPVDATAAAAPAHAPDLANGETMFNAGGCASCHAVPNQPQRTRLGGGVAITSPFGTFYAPNISPDPNDGIGRWSEADFVNAVMNGISPAGQHYFPAFPYTSYRHARREDVLDLFAYLKTLPPVAGKVSGHDVGFPFNIRRNIGIWKLLFMDDKPFVADGAKSQPWNRGAYLVNSFGHCAECHSPRNALGGVIRGERFAGGPNPEGEGWVPNITQKHLGDWSAKDIAYFLKTGELPDGDSAGGAMRRVIKNVSRLSDEDLAAMAEYIKSLPPVDGPMPPKRKESSG